MAFKNIGPPMKKQERDNIYVYFFGCKKSGQKCTL